MQLPAGYHLSTDRNRLDWERIQRWLASSYWTPGIKMERVRRAAKHSALLVGAFFETHQVGYARVVSDCTRFAYLCDVWVDEAHRGKGIGQAMVRFALDYPEFATVNWLLATLDAHRVYEKLGFTALPDPKRFMSRGNFCTGSEKMDPNSEA